MRLSVKGLLPDTQYTVQVRAKSGEDFSEWSPQHKFSTIFNSVLPKTPTNVSWVAMDKHFKGQWDKVNKQLDEDFAKVIRYDVELEKPDGSLREVIPVTASDEPLQHFKLGEQKMQALFGQILTAVKFRVRAVTQNENKSDWSAPITATIGAPNVPSGLVITPGPLTLKLEWTPPADMTNVEGYRVYVGTTAGFTPISPVWVGGAASYTYNALNFGVHHFKVCSYSRHNRESTYLTGSGTPGSLIDSDPPNAPSSINGSITNAADNKTATATVNWTLSSPPADLDGFNIRFRKVGAGYWDMASTDAAARTVTFGVTPFVNYEVSLQSLDTKANGSAWTSPLTLTAVVNTAPPTVTGLVSTPQRESIAYSWTASAATDVANQVGYYELQVSTINTFTVGTTTTFVSGFPTYDVAGLSPNTTYYARVRAVDSGGMASASWSTTDTETTQSFPLTPLSDGSPPASSPTPNVVSGIGYIAANWTAVSNADPVTYEVHLGTGSASFATSAATKVGDIDGTMTIIRNLPGTTNPLAYATNYYVRLIAKDRDGAAAVGTGSAAVQSLKNVIGDITLSPADIGAPTIAQAQGYATTAQTTAISTAATDAQTKATAAETNAKSYTDTRETAITSAYNAAITTSANGKNKITHSLSVASGANTAGDTWFQYNAQDQVIGQWRGMGDTSWISETVNSAVIANLDVAKLTTGTISSAVITINTTGQIKSQDYVANSAGWSLSNGGLQINNGIVDAKVMKANSSFVNNLFVESTIQVGSASTTGFIQSYGYSAGVTGFSLSKTGLIIEGAGNSIAAASINVGLIQASQIATSQITIGQTQVTGLAGALTTATANAEANIKTLWGHPSNTTFIDGGDIYTNSIRAKSMILADMSNYLSDPSLLDTTTSSWILTGGGSVVQAVGTTPGYILMNAPTSGNNNHSGDAAKWTARATEKFYVSVEIWGDAANTGTTLFGPCLQVSDAGGTAFSYPTWASNVANVPTGVWTTVAGEVTMPANTGFFQFLPYINASVVGNKVRMRNIKVMRKNGGELIVDGSITANALTAGTYTGGAFIIGAGGILRTLGSEVTLTSTGITVTGAGSSIQADSITSGDFTAGKTLNVKGTMKVATGGWIESEDFASSGGALGYRLTNTSLTIKEGSISAKTLTTGTIGGGAGITLAGSSYIEVASGYIRGNGYTGTSAGSNPSGVGWYIGSDGINMPTGAINIGSITSGNISSASFQVTGSGSIYGTGWSLGSGGLVVSSASGTTSIIGDAIKTGAIQSQGAQSYIAGSRGWSINTNGSVEFNTGTFRGALAGASGTFAGSLSGATGTFAGQITAGTLATGPSGTRRVLVYDSTWTGTAGIFFYGPTNSMEGSLTASSTALRMSRTSSSTYLEMKDGEMYVNGKATFDDKIVVTAGSGSDINISNIKSGRKTFSYGTWNVGETKSSTVSWASLPLNYTSVDRVFVASPEATNPQNWAVGYGGMGATGCTVYVTKLSGASTSVDIGWIATAQ